MNREYGYYALTAAIVAAVAYVFYSLNSVTVEPPPEAPVLDKAPSYMSNSLYMGSVANAPIPRMAVQDKPAIIGFESGWNSCGCTGRVYH